jgi:hypothetical protein
MHGELAGRTDRAAPDRRRRSLEWNGDSRLQALLREDAAADEAVVEVAVTRGCGAVEVRIVGPTAGLTLCFDHAEAHPRAVRFAVREAIARYRSALGPMATRVRIAGAHGADGVLRSARQLVRAYRDAPGERRLWLKNRIT